MVDEYILFKSIFLYFKIKKKLIFEKNSRYVEGLFYFIFMFIKFTSKVTNKYHEPNLSFFIQMLVTSSRITGPA